LWRPSSRELRRSKPSSLPAGSVMPGQDDMDDSEVYEVAKEVSADVLVLSSREGREEVDEMAERDDDVEGDVGAGVKLGSRRYRLAYAGARAAAVAAAAADGLLHARLGLGIAGRVLDGADELRSCRLYCICEARLSKFIGADGSSWRGEGRCLASGLKVAVDDFADKAEGRSVVVAADTGSLVLRRCGGVDAAKLTSKGLYDAR